MSSADSSKAPALDAEGERMWREVESVFGDPARHDRFIHHCSLSGALPAAARRYRDWLQSHPDHTDDVTATKMIQRITFLALQPLVHAPRPARKGLSRGTILLLVVVIAAVAGAALGTFSGVFSGGASR